MPTYNYKCMGCGKFEEQIHSIKETPVINCKCGSLMEKQFTLNIAGFIFKGGTPASHWKEKRLKLKKRESINQNKWRERQPKIQPNVAGHEVDSWSDAQKLAKEAGLNHESYQPLVEKEKPKIIV